MPPGILYILTLFPERKPLIFLGQAGGSGPNLGVCHRKQCSEDTGNNNISYEGKHALGKYLIGRFRINQDIQYRSKQTPGKSVGNDLYHIEQSNCFSIETAVLDGIFGCEQSHQDTEKSIREHPAPPYTSVEERITQSMADQADGSADDRSEYCREKCQDSDSGLQGGIGDDAERNLNVGENDEKRGSDTDSNKFFDTEF